MEEMRPNNLAYASSPRAYLHSPPNRRVLVLCTNQVARCQSAGQSGQYYLYTKWHWRFYSVERWPMKSLLFRVVPDIMYQILGFVNVVTNKPVRNFQLWGLTGIYGCAII